MSLDDLDLEFEDEEGEKKSDAVAVDVDLEFGTDTNVTIPKPSLGGQGRVVSKPSITPRPQAPQTKAPVAAASNPSNVRPITTRQESAVAGPQAKTPVMGSSALKVEVQSPSPEKIESEESIDQSELVLSLKEKITHLEVDTQIKIAVAEFKTDILSDLLSDIKLLEHQIGGLLNRIHNKHPDVKQEALMIKKLLSDFSTKKRK